MPTLYEIPTFASLSVMFTFQTKGLTFMLAIAHLLGKWQNNSGILDVLSFMNKGSNLWNSYFVGTPLFLVNHTINVLYVTHDLDLCYVL